MGLNVPVLGGVLGGMLQEKQTQQEQARQLAMDALEKARAQQEAQMNAVRISSYQQQAARSNAEFQHEQTVTWPQNAADRTRKMAQQGYGVAQGDLNNYVNDVYGGKVSFDPKTYGGFLGAVNQYSGAAGLPLAVNEGVLSVNPLLPLQKQYLQAQIDFDKVKVSNIENTNRIRNAQVVDSVYKILLNPQSLIEPGAPQAVQASQLAQQQRQAKSMVLPLLGEAAADEFVKNMPPLYSRMTPQQIAQGRKDAEDNLNRITLAIMHGQSALSVANIHAGATIGAANIHAGATIGAAKIHETGAMKRQKQGQQWTWGGRPAKTSRSSEVAVSAALRKYADSMAPGLIPPLGKTAETLQADAFGNLQDQMYKQFGISKKGTRNILTMRRTGYTASDALRYLEQSGMTKQEAIPVVRAWGFK